MSKSTQPAKSAPTRTAPDASMATLIAAVDAHGIHDVLNALAAVCEVMAKHADGVAQLGDGSMAAYKAPDAARKWRKLAAGLDAQRAAWIRDD